MIRLNSNENFYGCSPEVLKAINKKNKEVHLYPVAPTMLEKKLAVKFGVSPDNIVVGAGSVRLIDGIIESLTEPDDEIIIFEKSFVAYEQLAKVHNRKYFLAKQTEYTCDLDNVYSLISPKTKLLFIANPNNPTGTIISHSQLEKFLDKIPEKIIVVTDEAYAEYVRDKSFPDSISLQKKKSNLIILRTFSKIYGLAGLRIGYAIAEENISNLLKKNRIPFFFNTLSEKAAIVALEDEEFILSCAEKNGIEHDRLINKLTKNGLKVIPSQANFIYMPFNNEEEKEACFKLFIKNDLLICNMKIFGQEKALRITIGDTEVSEKIINLLTDIKLLEKV